MSLLLISPLSPATGNRATALRLASLLSAQLPAQRLVDAAADDAASQFAGACAADGLGLCIAIHASRAGRVVLADAGAALPPQVPLVLVLGGTDINHEVDDALDLGAAALDSAGCDGVGSSGLGSAAVDPRAAGGPSSGLPSTRAEVIASVISRAAGVVAFTPAMGERYLRFVERVGVAEGGRARSPSLLEADRRKLRIIPQSVDVSAAGLSASRVRGGSLGAGNRGFAAEPATADADAAVPHVALRAHLGLPASAVVLLLVAGVRPVKDPLFLVPAMREWHARDPALQLVVVGPSLDEQLTAALVAECRRGCGMAACCQCGEGGSPHAGSSCGGLWYLPPVPRATLLRWLPECDIALNSSLSEGQCSALLEAQALDVPVVARRNEGNACVIRHGETGMLFDTPGEAVDACRSLLGSEKLRERIIHAARADVVLRHSARAEAQAWRRLLEDLGVAVAPQE